MATTQYNQVLVGDLDITETYKKLMVASTGEDSIYIRMKETLKDEYENTSGLTDAQRANALATGLVELMKSISSNAMEMALKIETEKRDAPYVLTKMKEDTRRVTAEVLKVEKDIELADKNLWIGTVTGWKVQAEAYRDYGVQTWNQLETTKVLPEAAYVNYGTKVETLKKAKVDTYATYANTYRQNGIVNYTTNEADGSFNSVTWDDSGLTYWQTKVAERQRQGFDDNMRQHVVNSSSSMISMLLSTEASGINYAPYLEKWSTAAGWLSMSHESTAGSITVSAWGSLDKSSGHTISGTISNVTAGRAVKVVYTKISDNSIINGSSNIVLIGGTFTVITPTTTFSSLTIGEAYKVRVELFDDAGNYLYLDNNMTAVA